MLTRIFSNLKNTNRYSGLTLIKPENLESHILELIGMAYDLFYEFGDFDLSKLVHKIIIHDLDEAVTVDIPRPFKYFSSEFREVLEKTTRAYIRSIGFSDSLVKDISNAKDDSNEGNLLKLLDLFQVQYKLSNEVSLGNSKLAGELDRVKGYINDLIRDKQELYKYYKFIQNA